MRQQRSAPPNRLTLSKLPRSSRLCSRCQGTATEDYVDGETLRTVREKARVSLRQMARDLSLSPMYLSDIERNRRSATDYIIGGYEALLL